MYEIALWLADPPHLFFWYPLVTCFVGFLAGYFVRRSEERDDERYFK